MRKAPAEHAKEYPLGFKKVGNDGNIWKIMQTTKGVKRWKKARGPKASRKISRNRRHRSRRNPHRPRNPRRRRHSRSKQRAIHSSKAKTAKINRTLGPELPKRGGKTYFIHDNGGRPFQVVISGKKVSVYEQPNWRDWQSETGKEYTKLIKTFSKVKKIFIGKDRKLGRKFDGNSVLLQLSKDKYVYIGSWIYEFVAKDDRIVAYYSQVGNSDVPYPVALGEKNVYFMLDPIHAISGRKMGGGLVPRSTFPPNTDWEDAYMLFYGHRGLEPLGKYGKKFHKVKIIQKRHW